MREKYSSELLAVKEAVENNERLDMLSVLDDAEEQEMPLSDTKPLHLEPTERPNPTLPHMKDRYKIIAYNL